MARHDDEYGFRNRSPRDRHEPRDSMFGGRAGWQENRDEEDGEGRYGSERSRGFGGGRYGGQQSDRGGYGGGYGGSYGDSREDDGMSGGSYGGRGSYGGGYGGGGRSTGGQGMGRGGGSFGGGQGRYGGEQGGMMGGSGMGGYGMGGYGMGSSGMGGGMARGKGPKGYTRSDERIKESVCDCLTDDSHLDAGEIEVQVKSGEVTLSGTVPDRQAKRHAEDLVEHLSGVKHVQNNLRVKEQQGSGRSQTNLSS